jgi:TolB-like protein
MPGLAPNAPWVANPEAIRDDVAHVAGAPEMAEGDGDEKASARAPTVFISYASQDTDAAERICDALRAVGLEVWFDRRELRGGDAWDASIRKQIKECLFFVPLISAATNARSEGYFRREWNLAVNRMLDIAEDQPFLMPVVIDDTSEAAARVPERFRERQWTRVPGGMTPAEFAERVLRLSAADRATEATASVPARTVTFGEPARANEGFGIAVLPFKYRGNNADLLSLAEVLPEEIVTGLSRFSYLRVIARGCTSQYASGRADVRTIAREIGARYVMEGNLQQAGTSLRVAVQLVDTACGAHLWAETYTQPFEPERIFAIQDELIARVVSTCGDRFGVLARSISDTVRGTKPGRLGPYEALMRGFGYHHRLTPAEHAEAREALERAVDRAPANADCWAMLSWIYSHEYAHGFNIRPAALERALTAARRAVDIAPSNQLAQQALAVVLFFRKETAGCLSAAERALALNPLDGSNEAIFLITFTGDWERGCALLRRAMEINPHHPRWYGVVLAINEYRRANYGAAVNELLKANAPEVFWTNWMLAAAYGQLGELTAAHNALREVLAQKEDFAQSAGQLLDKWFDPQLAEHLMAGLLKAGLEPSAAKSSGGSVQLPRR